MLTLEAILMLICWYNETHQFMYMSCQGKPDFAVAFLGVTHLAFLWEQMEWKLKTTLCNRYIFFLIRHTARTSLMIDKRCHNYLYKYKDLCYILMSESIVWIYKLFAWTFALFKNYIKHFYIKMSIQKYVMLQLKFLREIMRNSCMSNLYRSSSYRQNLKYRLPSWKQKV